MIEIFRTNVQKKAQGKMLNGILSDALPSLKINFDLSDCDKVLRVEGENIAALTIIVLMQEHGFTCDVLD